MDFDPEAVREFEREGWNRAARAYETSFATATRQFIQALLDAAGVGQGAVVLDVACGPGFVTQAAADRGDDRGPVGGCHAGDCRAYRGGGALPRWRCVGGADRRGGRLGGSGVRRRTARLRFNTEIGQGSRLN